MARQKGVFKIEGSPRPLKLIHKIKPRSSGILFLLLGIEFVQVVTGEQIPLRNGRANTLAIVGVGDE